MALKQPSAADHAGDWYACTDGTIRWHSNDRIPFKDVLTLLMEAEQISSEQFMTSIAVRKQEDEAFFREYIANHTGPSAEERAEARAAFGAGVTLVNVITGRKWTT